MARRQSRFIRFAFNIFRAGCLMSAKKTVFAVVSVLLVAAVTSAYFVNEYIAKPKQGPVAAGNGAMQAVAVEAEAPTIGSINRTIEAVGTLISDESVVLSPELAGRVSEISFNEGEAVTIGQSLIKLDAAVNAAELAEAEAALALSVANHSRAERLFKSGSGTERARDEALSAMNADKARVDLAKARLDKMDIKAPFNGVAGLRNVSVGDYVTPGQSLTNIEKIDVLKVDFRIPEVYLGSLRQGQKINVRVDAFAGQVFDGEVFAVNPRIDESGRSIILRARLDNDEMILRPGLFARVNLIVENRDNALMIPEQALWPQGNQQAVYTIVDNKPVLVTVQTGLRRNGMVEITEGLSASDMVVTAGQMKIRPNSSVTIIPTNAAAGE